MAGAGAGLSSGMMGATGSSNQLQMPTYLQPLFGNAMSNVTPQNFTSNQAIGQNTYGYNMGRLSSMMDPSANLPQYANPYSSQQQFYAPPSQLNYAYNPFGFGNFNPFLMGLGMQMGEPDFFAPAPSAAPTPAPAPASQTFGQSTPTFDTSALENQIRSLESQIQALTQARTQPSQSTAEQIADLGIGHQEQGVRPGTVASGDVAAPPPPATAEPSAPPAPVGRDEARQQAISAGIRGANGMNAQQLANALNKPVTNIRGQVIQPQPVVRNPAYQFLGAGSPQFQNQYVYAGTSIPAPAPTTTTVPASAPAPAPAPAPATSSSATTAAAPSPAPSPAPISVSAGRQQANLGSGASAQKVANTLGVPVVNSAGKVVQPKQTRNAASGGIIHNGMTNRLKQMIGN